MATLFAETRGPFIYRPLDTVANEIRLLELHPDNEGKDLKCSLHHHRLDACISYEALSYVWGSHRDTVSVSIGTSDIGITADLATALHRLRNPANSRLLWIDQICINQVDDAERSSQVSLMQKVYENATCVVIWLGEDETGEQAMSFIRESNIAAIEPRFEEAVMPHLLASFKDEFVAIAQSIMSNVYFERYWIIQEIVLAQDTVVCYGSQSASWERVIRFMEALRKYSPSLVRIAREQRNLPGSMAFLYYRLNMLQKARRHAIWNAKFHAQGGGSSDDLFTPWQLILSFRYSKATVPSDRIYAWLGLCDQWRDTGFEIDYTRNTHDTFKLFARVMIERDRSLNWLSHAGSPRNLATLPSWVPDLELPIGNRPDPLMLTRKGLYAADRGSEFSVRFSPDSCSLFCEGVCVDKISFLTAILEDIIEICRTGKFDSLCTPSDLLHAARSRYGAFLEGHLHNLYTAERQAPNESRAPSRAVSGTNYAEMCLGHRTLSPSPWLSSMQLLGESTLNKRAIFISEKGYVGLVPHYACAGDVVCVLFGSEVPVVLRKVGDCYRFIGDCYVARLMDGEYSRTLQQGETSVETFELR